MYKLFILLFFSASIYAQTSPDTLNRTDKNGLKQGKWIKYYPESEFKRYEGQFKDDLPFGTFTYYFATGEVRTILKYTAENRATARNYYPDGTLIAIGVYAGNQKDSTWTYYSRYGEKLAVDYYIEGKLYGNCKKYHINGELLEERYFENNLENGPFKQYYENGIISREGTYVNGSLEGESAFYHPNGVLRFEGSYVKDAKQGIWKKYNEQGELIDERKYDKGIPESRDSDIIFEDSTKYYKKDYLEIEDFIDEDYMAIPEDDKRKKKKK